MNVRNLLHASLTVAAAALISFAGATAQADDEKPIVVLETSAGQITVELDKAKAPISVANFLKYVDKGFYDGVTFHRVIPGFMVQTGGMKEANNVMTEKKEEAFPPIKNESGNGLSNSRGTLAMARTQDPNSATSQFFINHKDNPQLDNYGGGYAVFGKVISGMDVVDSIAKVETATKSDSAGHNHENVPVTPVIIKSAKRKTK